MANQIFKQSSAGIICISCLFTGTLMGFLLGGAAGLGLGALLLLGHTKQVPPFPAHTSAYVALGGILFGSLLGAAMGFISGITLIVIRFSRRKEFTDQQVGMLSLSK